MVRWRFWNSFPILTIFSDFLKINYFEMAILKGNLSHNFPFYATMRHFNDFLPNVLLRQKP